jgi:serine/threonine-protein kinase
LDIPELADESVPEEPGTVIGTLAYMAPEQARGESAAIGPPADIWALGVILYQCLTGRLPFLAANPQEAIRQALDGDPVPPRHLDPRVPRDLEAICLKCLEKKIENRYASAAALAEDLRFFLEARPIEARPAGVLKRGWKWVQRHPTAVALGIGVLLGLLLGIGLASPLLSAFRG